MLACVRATCALLLLVLLLSFASYPSSAHPHLQQQQQQGGASCPFQSRRGAAAAAAAALAAVLGDDSDPLATLNSQLGDDYAVNQMLLVSSEEVALSWLLHLLRGLACLLFSVLLPVSFSPSFISVERHPLLRWCSRRRGSRGRSRFIPW